MYKRQVWYDREDTEQRETIHEEKRNVLPTVVVGEMGVSFQIQLKLCYVCLLDMWQIFYLFCYGGWSRPVSSDRRVKYRPSVYGFG